LCVRAVHQAGGNGHAAGDQKHSRARHAAECNIARQVRQVRQVRWVQGPRQGRAARRYLLAFLLGAQVLVAQEFPAPVGKVNDFANLLRTEDRTAIEATLAGVERDTTAEIALVTVRALDGRSIEEYANRLFQEWGIGKKGRDNGVLILVARDDREIRIEVGYGLEGVLPDGLAGAIIRETFVPRFRDGQYREGLVEGTTRVADIVRRNEAVTADQRAALDRAEAEAGQSWVVAIFLSIFVGFGAFTMGTGAAARAVVPLLSGLFFTGMALFMSLLGAPLAGIILLALFAVVVAVIGYRLGRRPDWQQTLRGSGGRSGGWVMGSSGSSRSGGSRSGGFGGGRSGGGGASGRW
jgi:uncharacterized protein